MSGTPELDRLQTELRYACRGDERSLFALLDAARIRGLPVFLRETGSEFACLYRGAPATELAHVAPYLVKLPLSSLLVPWLLVDTNAAASIVILVAQASLEGLRAHLRRFLIVLDQNFGENFFRFYDPRVIGPFLDVCTVEEKTRFFGPVRLILTCASTPPVKEPLFHTWISPEGAGTLAPPAAFDKFALRQEHEDRFAADALANYRERCVVYLKGRYSSRLQDKSAEEVSVIVDRAREMAPSLGLVAGRDVTRLAEVLVLDPSFAAKTRLEERPVRERSGDLIKLRDVLEQLSEPEARVLRRG